MKTKLKNCEVLDKTNSQSVISQTQNESNSEDVLTKHMQFWRIRTDFDQTFRNCITFSYTFFLIVLQSYGS